MKVLSTQACDEGQSSQKQCGEVTDIQGENVQNVI